MSEYIETVPKSHFNQILEYNPLPTSELNQFWGSACPRMHIYEWYCISSVSKFKKKRKEKRKRKTDLPTLPIFRPKGQTNLLFFKALYKGAIASALLYLHHPLLRSGDGAL